MEWEFGDSKGTLLDQFVQGNKMARSFEAQCDGNMVESAKSQGWMVGAR
jgi:hypothetical protein